MKASLLTTLRSEFEHAADPSRAEGMQAYMKSSMPCHGVATTQMRQICKKIFANHTIDNEKKWQKDVLTLWHNAEYREERYAAIELTDDKRAKSFQVLAALPMYEEMITSGAWWDYVDTIAIHRLDKLLKASPKDMKKKMREWSKCDDLWKRRSAIICQITFKETTDLKLLYDCIEPAISSKEFFLRKAIGWALRQYARTDEKEIVRYVNENEKRLSPLSKREALKNVSITAY